MWGEGCRLGWRPRGGGGNPQEPSRCLLLSRLTLSWRNLVGAAGPLPLASFGCFLVGATLWGGVGEPVGQRGSGSFVRLQGTFGSPFPTLSALLLSAVFVRYFFFPHFDCILLLTTFPRPLSLQRRLGPHSFPLCRTLASLGLGLQSLDAAASGSCTDPRGFRIPLIPL